ncbi:hypothetical protein M4D70_19155 [Brevibacillus borstelensis]|uniref:hypothetical protein n=1 Tax=Brevibacillus borstelensis TaxID=45462 RepID=UPI00203C4FE8|nr:hypothetical protein [Brevibacillus borstelensis]MCM3624348.1 hypothetical protein [Brevibacillus borstelensis]
MPAEASLQELQIVYSEIQSMREIYPNFFDKLLILMYKTERAKIPFGYVCQRIMDVEINERYIKGNQRMRSEIHHDLFCLKTEHYEGYHHFSDLLKNNRLTGYNSICRMILGDKPEDLKRGNFG